MLNKLKALFIVPEEKPVQKKDKETNTAEPKKEKSITSKGRNSANEQIMTELLTVLNDNNQEGFDYIEFKNAINQLKSMEMDEKTRYISAFTTAKTLGVTAPKLIESISIYLKVLQQEQVKFNESLRNSDANLTASQKREYSDLIAQKKDEIFKLKQEIVELEKKIHGVSGNNYTKFEFESTLNILIQQMRADIRKINEYL